MSNMKRTPAPWYATHHPKGHTDVQSAIKNEDNYVARVDNLGDAQLITIAPELLEAAKEVLRQADEYRDMDRNLPVTGAGNPIDPLRRIVDHMEEI